MIISGQKLVDLKYITFSNEAVDIQDQIQPNGVDLRVNKIYEASGAVSIPREGRTKANMQVNDLELKDGFWSLKPGRSYWVDFLEDCKVADGYAADLFTRSSLVRAGVDVQCGLWDTGWQGRLGGTLRVFSPVQIQWAAKLCQVVFFKAEFRGQRYDGRYQGLSETDIANEHRQTTNAGQ